MGIQHLNQFMRANCPDAIKPITLGQLRDKVIAVDTSIYMYRFAGEGILVEGMYQLISLFRHYDIVPVFIFDGKMPVEKNEIMGIRRDAKAVAEKKYNNIKERMETCGENEDVRELKHDMDSLRKKFVRLRNADVRNVKKLMDVCGVTYYDAEGEADQLCAKLVIKRKAYACLSEDMDLFVYGCPRVLRYLNLTNSRVVLYSLKYILKNLDVSLREFKEICIISGTDYNSSESKNCNLHKTLKHFAKYKKNKSTEEFYIWLERNTSYISDYCKLCSTFFMFDTCELNISKMTKQRMANYPINKKRLHDFLHSYDFLFLN
jgi:5'-3' exonuclease